MLDEFVNFCEDLFPSINPYKIESLRTAMDQFKKNGKFLKVDLDIPLDYLAQGDIFDKLYFTYIDENGEQIQIERKAILLSNTCDAQRNENLIFAAIHNYK